MNHAAPPPRPGPLLERVSGWFFLRFGPRLAAPPALETPQRLWPFEALEIARRGRPGHLHATYYPALEATRGAVLFLHPWLEFGQAYFHRRGRIEAARQAGYHALAVDLGGFGRSAAPRGFLDRDIEEALDALRARAPGLPLFVWGVSSGGYWTHPVLARRGDVAAAMFEDVSPHLLEWSLRQLPRGARFFHFFRLAFPSAYRFLDMRRHAPFVRPRGVAYVSGALDAGVRPDDTRELARLAGGRAWVVDDAPHLGAIKRDPQAVIALALQTFARGPAA